jgi:hypothetical protein
MAGGWFTKQADFLTAANLNDVNDQTVGGQIQSVPTAVPAGQGIQTLPGDRIILDDATAYALSDTTIGTLYGGIYMYVQASYTTQAPVVGAIAFLKAADLGNLKPTSPLTTGYVAYGDAQPTTLVPSYVLGVWINVLTKSYYGWVQIAGIASVLFDSTVTATTTGGLVIAKASAAVASTADNLTSGYAVTGLTLVSEIGVSMGTVVTSTLSKVAILRGMGRL